MLCYSNGTHNKQFPVTNLDAVEVPGGLELGVRGAAATTDVAGAEQQTRTGHQYSEISGSHVKPTAVALEEETSRREGSHIGFTVVPSTAAEAHTCEGSGMLLEGSVTTAYQAQHPGTFEESSARQTSFTKLAVETEVESVEKNDARRKVDTSIGDRDEVFTEVEYPRSLSPAEDFNRVQWDRDVEGLEGVKLEEVLPDGRTDHPTSTEETQPSGCVKEEEGERGS